MNTLRNALVILFALMQPQTPGAVQGIISKYGSGDPIPGARVELIRTDGTTPQTYSSVSGPDGSFIIQNARPGQYRLAVTRTGYLRREFGQRSRDGFGSVLNLEAGRQIRNLDVELRPSATISGRITDTEGASVVTAEVRALVPAYQNGQRILRTVQSAVTNDLGEYRLFGLPAGRYYVSAAQTTAEIPLSILIVSSSLPAPGVSGPRPRTAVYYPSTTDSRTATPIDLTSGGDFGGVNITIVPYKPHHIRGSVPGGMSRVTLVPNDPGLVTSARDADASSGPFDFANVASGEYTLVARSGDMLGTASVSVGDGDVDNVTVGLSSGVPVPTRVSIDDRRPGDVDPDLEGVTFSLVADPPIPGADPERYGPFPNGFLAFGVLQRLDYRITLLPFRGETPPRLRDVYVKSIQMGTRDVLNDGLRIDDPANIPPLEVVLGTRSGILTGTVVSEKQKPQANATVLLIPDAGRRRWFDSFRMTSTDIAGRYTLGRIPPGDYIALSWEELEEDAWMDPEFVKRYEQRGKRIHVNEGGNQNLNITAIP